VEGLAPSLVEETLSSHLQSAVAQADIQPDTVLFTIPRPSILSVANSDLCKKCPQLFAPEPCNDEQGDDMPVSVSNSWTSLILTMIYEYLQGDNSAWKPYFDVLPSRFDTLMFWSEAEVAELQGSTVRHKVGKAEAETTFRQKILPALENHSDVFYPWGSTALGDNDAIALAHRMGSLIMSYSFELDKDDDEDAEADGDNAQDGWVEDNDTPTLAMLPMADILNSDAEFNVSPDPSSAEPIT
jgi:N-lysine methyltransferase SETD6